MTVGLIILCFILSYIFSYFFSFSSIVAFNSLVILLHYFMGPKLLLEYVYFFCSYFYILLLFVVSHYYISSVLVLIVCTWSIVRSCVHLFYPEGRSWQLNDVREELMELHAKVDNLELKIERILTLLTNIEV